MARTSSADAGPRALIISANHQTSRELQRYLTGAGVRAAGHAELRHAQVGAGRGALVLFPDDFVTDDVITHLASARAAHPTATLIVVTAHPQHFEHAVARDGAVLRLIVLPRPAFGWAILEAIRADAN